MSDLLNTLILDPVQEEAVDRALHMVRNGGGAFKLLGKAGTGKTTTGLALVHRLLDAGYKVICCAYTNKAVNRMGEVGYPKQHCRTINRLLYKTGIVIRVGDFTFSTDQADKILRTDDPNKISKILDDVGVFDDSHDPEDRRKRTNSRRYFIIDMIKKGRGDRVSGTVLKTEEELKKEGIDRKTVIVVDELSMCPLDSADELHGMFDSVIYVGDPGQLPPVNSVDTCKYLGCDDEVTLSTIHRVSGNSYLLDIIYELDAGKIPDRFNKPIDVAEFRAFCVEGYQFITYTNNGVAWMNEECRRTLGLHGMEPQEKEPLITVTQTRAERTVNIDDRNRDYFIKNEARLTGQYEASQGRSGAVYTGRRGRLNGPKGRLELVTMYRTIQKNMILETHGSPVKLDDSDAYLMPVIVDGDPNQRVWMVRTLPFWEMNQGRKRAFRKVGSSMTLDFAYAITAHKSQGSEWPKVAVQVRQIYKQDRGNHELIDEVKRWNYTAATRGKEDIQLFTSIIGCPHG
jgi:exodeoxyribonuclease-5